MDGAIATGSGVEYGFSPAFWAFSGAVPSPASIAFPVVGLGSVADAETSVKSSVKTVLVTGASGWIGRAVCQWLKAHGREVIAAVRRPEGKECWDAVLEVDLPHLSTVNPRLVQLLARADAIIHCAAHVHRPFENGDERELFRSVNVDGTRALLDAALECGVRRIVYASTIAIYDWESAGDAGVSVLAEPSPGSCYAETKLTGENIIRESGVDWRVVRLATVFGRGDKANFAKLARAMKKRKFIVPGAGSARKSVIPVEMAAALLGGMALLDEPKHRLIHGALGHSPTLREICDTFSEVCAFPRAGAVPETALKVAGKLGDIVNLFGARSPLSTGTLSRLTTSTVVQIDRMRETFPHYHLPTFAEALKPAADYYRSL